MFAVKSKNLCKIVVSAFSKQINFACSNNYSTKFLLNNKNLKSKHENLHFLSCSISLSYSKHSQMSTLSLIEKGKKASAYQAVDDHIDKVRFNKNF